jgi:hypothetical protein
VLIRLSGPTSGFQARLDSPSAPIARPPARWKDWWEDPLIGGPERDHSRAELVRYLRNTDGGGHVDLALDADFVALLDHAEGITFGMGSGPDAGNMTATWGGSASELGGAAAGYVDATMRQIAHELLRSLQRDWRTEDLVAAVPYQPTVDGLAGPAAAAPSSAGTATP